MIDTIIEDLTENTRLLKWVTQPEAFIDRLLFRVRQDTFFFGESDYAALDSKRDNLAYVIAYVLIRTVATSNETKDLRHTADFNPFTEYRLPDSVMQETSPDHNARKNLVQISRYMYDELTAARQAFPSFRSELLAVRMFHQHRPPMYHSGHVT